MRISTLPGVLLLPLSLALPSIVAASDADQISIKERNNGGYEITLSSTEITDIESATQRLMPAASEVCGDLEPKLGRYTFEKSEPLKNRTGDVRFNMVQNIECVESRQRSAGNIRRTQLPDEQAVEAVRSKVGELSKEYFNASYANLGSDANSALNTKRGDPKLREPTAVGTPIDINLYRITVYDNPSSAPSDGVYVAVDYDNRVGNVAHHCGYLMWHSPDAAVFTLGRIESGTLDSKLLNKMKADDIPPTLKALRCSNFYDK